MAEIREAEFLTVGKARTAILWPTLGLTAKTLHSCAFSAHGGRGGVRPVQSLDQLGHR